MDSCPVCAAELATVKLTTNEGTVQIGPKCSRINNCAMGWPCFTHTRYVWYCGWAEANPFESE